MGWERIAQIRVSIIVSIIVSLTALPVSAYAVSATDRMGTDLSEYQAIIDKVNAEYGTDIRFISEQESLEFMLPLPCINNLGTLAEFERNLRLEAEVAVAEIDYSSRMNEQALARGEAIEVYPMTKEFIIEDGEVVGFVVFTDQELLCSDGNEAPGSRAY